MKTKITSIIILLATVILTGCNTTATSQSSVIELTAEDYTTTRLLGGKIGTQIAAAPISTRIQERDAASSVASSDERAYRNWKKANRS